MRRQNQVRKSNKSLQRTFDLPSNFAGEEMAVASNAAELKRYVSRDVEMLNELYPLIEKGKEYIN